MGKRTLTLATAAAVVNAISVGIASTYSSTAAESMKTGKLNLTDDEVSWIGNILPLGAIVGSIAAGYLSDKIGRKGVMMYLSLLLVGGWLCIAYANSLALVYVGTFITGICCGLICVVTPMYVVEISTTEMRGNLGTFFQMNFCSGILISSLCGKFLSLEWLALVGALIAVLALLVMLPVPESPRWLQMHNKNGDAIRAVKYLYGDTVEPSVNQLISESLDDTSNSRIALHEFSQPSFYKPALLSIGLTFFQQFCGFNAILYCTVSTFKQVENSVDPKMVYNWVAFVMYIFTVFTSSTMDVIGRKKSLYISGFVTCISLNFMSVYWLLASHDSSLKVTLGWIPLLCLMVYMAGFSVGLGPIPWLMMSEMSPVRTRGVICGLGTALSWTFVFIVTKSSLQIESLVDNFGAYWIYSGFCLLSCFFTSFFLPETKRKTMEEIENYFAGGESPIQPLPEPEVEGAYQNA